MKSLIFALLASAPLTHAADVYSCTAPDGNFAELTVTTRGLDVLWDEAAHDDSSAGVGSGKETAPYSEWAGYDLYKLTAFFSTADSAHMLAVEPTPSARTLNAYSYFDNDDHTEDIVRYTCTLK